MGVIYKVCANYTTSLNSIILYAFGPVVNYWIIIHVTKWLLHVNMVYRLLHDIGFWHEEGGSLDIANIKIYNKRFTECLNIFILIQN